MNPAIAYPILILHPLLCRLQSTAEEIANWRVCWSIWSCLSCRERFSKFPPLCRESCRSGRVRYNETRREKVSGMGLQAAIRGIKIIQSYWLCKLKNYKRWECLKIDFINPTITLKTCYRWQPVALGGSQSWSVASNDSRWHSPRVCDRRVVARFVIFCDVEQDLFVEFIFCRTDENLATFSIAGKAKEGGM